MTDKPTDATVTGRVTDLFGHRFVIATKEGKRLADLGPKGADEVKLSIGDEVTLTGERKPTEIKVHTISVGARKIDLKRDPGKHAPVEAETALAAVRAIGFEPEEPLSRKPKHFEIIARRGGERREFHVEFDGSIRKAKLAKAGAQP